MKAGKNTSCIYTILLYFGSPHIVVCYNNERTVWFLSKYKGKFDAYSCYSFPVDDYQYELPLCEIEKLDVIFEPRNHFPKIGKSGWIEDYDLRVYLKREASSISYDESCPDKIIDNTKRVKSYQEIFERV